jgi:hypothetical protein
MDEKKLALQLAEKSAEIITRKLAIVELERKALEAEEAELKRRVGGNALSMLASAVASTSTSLSPYKSSGGLETGKQATDSDGRVLEITLKNSFADRVKESLGAKRTIEPGRHPFYMEVCLTVINAERALQVVLAKSFDPEMAKHYGIMMSDIQAGKPLTAGLDIWATSVLITKIQYVRVMTNEELLKKVLLWKYLFMDHSNLCLMHFDLDTRAELDLSGDLLSLRKDKFLRCILGFELVYACMCSSAWINSTLDFRNRVEYGDLSMTNRPFLRNKFELMLCTFGGELSWPISQKPGLVCGRVSKIDRPSSSCTTV